MTRSKSMSSICAAYKPPQGPMSRAERVTDFLIYFGEEAPYNAVPAIMIHKTVAQLTRVPQKNSQEVLALIGGMPGVAKLLKRKHGKLLINVKGVGYRVSVNSGDAAKHRGANSVRAHISSGARVQDDFAYIDVSDIKDDPVTKAWATRVVKHLKEHNAADVIKGILPPGTPMPKKPEEK